MKKIKLDNYELKLVIHSLNELRNSLINQNKDFEIVDINGKTIENRNITNDEIKKVLIYKDKIR